MLGKGLTASRARVTYGDAVRVHHEVCACGRLVPSNRRLCAQIGDLATPAGDQLIALWISAFSDDSLLTESEFVLRVNESGRPAAVDPLEAARTEDAITANLGEFLGGDSSANFTCQLFLDDSALPLAARPQRHENNENEWKKQEQILKTCDDPSLKKGRVWRRSKLGKFFPGLTQQDGDDQPKTVIEGVGENGQRQTNKGATKRNQYRVVCRAIPRKAPKIPVNIACPPKPNSAKRAPY